MAFHPLERLMNLYDGYQQAFSINGHSLLLIQDEGRCRLIINQCPHQQAPLTRATLEQGAIRCPVHGIRFDINTGQSLDGCNQGLKFISLVYEGNQIGIDI